MNTKIGAIALTIVICAFGVAHAGDLTTQVRTVYALGNTNGFPTFPLNVFVAWDGDLFVAETLAVPTAEEGYPVGLALDSTNGRLYVANTGTTELMVFDAVGLEMLDGFVVPDADELAGMDIDDAAGRFYISNRESDEMFVYDVNTLALQDSWLISAGLGAFGISVNDGVMYVGAGSNTVPYFDVETHEQIGSFTITDAVLALDVWNTDPPVVFTTPGYLTNILTRYDLGSGEETRYDLDAVAKGLTVDNERGLVYQLAGSGPLPQTSLRVIDGAALTEVDRFELGNGTWSPTDVKAGWNDFGYRVVVTPDDEDRLLDAGETLTASVVVTNRHDKAIGALPFEVLFDDAVLDFVSADPAPDGSKASSSLTWDDLAATFGEDLAPDASFTLEVTFTAKLPDGCINAAPSSIVGRSEGSADVDEAVLDDYAGVAGIAVSCPCSTDADCDEGEFCAGAATCNDAGQCEYAGDPCEGGNLCDEDADECVPPAGDDDADDDDADDDDDDSDDKAGCGC